MAVVFGKKWDHCFLWPWLHLKRCQGVWMERQDLHRAEANDGPTASVVLTSTAWAEWKRKYHWLIRLSKSNRGKSMKILKISKSVKYRKKTRTNWWIHCLQAISGWKHKVCLHLLRPQVWQPPCQLTTRTVCTIYTFASRAKWPRQDPRTAEKCVVFCKDLLRAHHQYCFVAGSCFQIVSRKSDRNQNFNLLHPEKAVVTED